MARSRLNPEAPPFIQAPAKSTIQPQHQSQPQPFSRSNKPTFTKAQFPPPQYNDTSLNPTPLSTPAQSLQEYQTRMDDHHQRKRFWTQRIFSTAHRYSHDDSGTWEHAQVPGSFDYFTQTYNVGYAAHCVACAKAARSDERKWDKYPDLRALVEKIRTENFWRLNGSRVFLRKEEVEKEKEKERRDRGRKVEEEGMDLVLEMERLGL